MISIKLKLGFIKHYKHLLNEVQQNKFVRRSFSIWKKFSNIYCNEKKETFPKNIVFFGNDNFSLPSLKRLYKQKNKGIIDRLHVVTTLAKPSSPVASFCKEMKIPHSKWPIEASLRGYDIGIVVSFGHLIPDDVIKAFPLGILNVHASLLPRWRGANPVVHAILNGDRETGITIMKIHPFKFDVGDIMYQKNVKVEKNVKSLELLLTLAEVGAECLMYCLNNISLLNHSKKQPNVGMTKAPKIKTEFCEIIWDKMSRRTISLMFHAFDDYYPLWSTWHGKNVQLQEFVTDSNFDGESGNSRETLTMYDYIKDMKKIYKRKSESIEKEIEYCKGYHLTSGQVAYIKPKKVLRVRCLNGFVEFKSIKIEGRKKMSALEFYNGFMSKVDCTKHYFY